MQIEREDIMQVYLHKGGDMGLLTSAQQAAIIVQADNHLKKAKGKAMLPRLTKKDVLDILQVCMFDYIFNVFQYYSMGLDECIVLNVIYLIGYSQVSRWYNKLS